MKTILSIILGFLIGVLSNTFFNSFKMTKGLTIAVIILVIILAIGIGYLERKEKLETKKQKLTNEKNSLIQRFNTYKYSQHHPSGEFILRTMKLCRSGDLYYLENMNLHFTKEEILKLLSYGKIDSDDYKLINQ